jgi:predicted O-methyltransferase YrrM
LQLARETSSVVEIGTATGWTAAALAIGLPKATISTYDPVLHPQRADYLALLPPAVRARITCVTATGTDGPLAGEKRVGLLFLDGAHEREETIATLQAWEHALAPGALVVFHDYAPAPDGGPAHYPGVAEAVTELDLQGVLLDDLFVWRRSTAP